MFRSQKVWKVVVEHFTSCGWI